MSGRFRKAETHESGVAGGRPELWGGYECTVNRVGDSWNDQTLRSGHEHRVADLNLFAELGIKSLRYPALWERISPSEPEVRDFTWTDERLARIRELEMNPILTLCHHGSGPWWTSLVDDGFALGLARHAAAVAERYPWVRDYTPVNEPLTTARFSALYGYWHPHTRDEGLFWTALLNQIDATRLSMRAIREVNPRARLIQTDDLGYCHATPPLQEEANYQNHRRWMAWDLLCGRVTPEHPLQARLVGFGLQARLDAIADDPCPPDVIGVNHYLASERLLDHRTELYEDRPLADRELGEHRGVRYVDVDAVRNLRTPLVGLPGLLVQAWRRYGIPVAVTEVHNGCTREEQARWFVEVWDSVTELRRQGADIPAVTAWSLLGSHDWNRLLTRLVGHYEVGVFDVRSGTPRATLLAPVMKALARGERPEAECVIQPGWWRRSATFQHHGLGDRPDCATQAAAFGGGRPLLVVGRGSLAALLTRACRSRGLTFRRAEALSPKLLAEAAPWAVIDGRDWAGVCETSGSRAAPLFAPPVTLVTLCAEHDVACAVFSLSAAFGEVEERLLELGGPRLLLAGTDRVFMPWDRSRMAARALDAFDCGLRVEANPAAAWTDTYGPDLVDAVLDLTLDRASGPHSFVFDELWSEADFVRTLAEVAEAEPDLLLERFRPTVIDNDPRVDPGWGGTSLLTPGLSTVERFVKDSRSERRAAAATRYAAE
jgi:dTDP-4-dehydrorhamnose reductase